MDMEKVYMKKKINWNKDLKSKKSKMHDWEELIIKTLTVSYNEKSIRQ